MLIVDAQVMLARRGNIAVKASALRCYSTESYPFPGLHAHIRRVYDAFGSRRIFRGTDWTRLPCPWRQAVTLFTEELPWLSGEDKEWIMGRAICEWLGWKTGFSVRSTSASSPSVGSISA